MDEVKQLNCKNKHLKVSKHDIVSSLQWTQYAVTSSVCVSEPQYPICPYGKTTLETH